MNILILYITVQLLSTACILGVMDKVKPEINNIIKENGYNPNKVNQMIDFNDKLGKILKGLIPLYYAVLSLSLITNKNKVESYALNEIKTGKFEKTDEIENIEYQDTDEEEYVDESVINENFKVNIRPQKQYNWNIPVTEKYVARRNNDIEFKAEEPAFEEVKDTEDVKIEVKEEMGLSPFEIAVFEKPEVQNIEIEEPIEEIKDIEEIKNTEEIKETKKETVTKRDIAKAIVALDYKQLDELDAKIRYLSELKKNKKLILDKDIA